MAFPESSCVTLRTRACPIVRRSRPETTHGLGLVAVGCGTLHNMCHASILDESATCFLYSVGLVQAGIHASHSRCESTLALRRLMSAELQSHFRRLPPTWGVNILSAQPIDVVVFVAHVWVPHHGRIILASGHVYPSASHLRGAFNALEYVFDRSGRGSVWTLSNPFNNPCRITIVDDYKRGLEKFVDETGPAPKATLEESKLLSLVTSLDTYFDARRADMERLNNPYRRLHCMIPTRDTLLFTNQFYSLQRDVEGDRIGLSNLSFPSDNRPLRLGDNRLLTAPTTCVRTGWTKTDVNGGTFKIDRAEDSRLCFMRRLHAYASACVLLGQPSTTPDFHLFRPIDTLDRGIFSRATMTSAACLGRLKNALNLAGAKDGETVHSSRRGGMQRERAAGVPAEQTMARALMKTRKIYDLYVDTNRPTRRRTSTPETLDACLSATEAPSHDVKDNEISRMARS